MTQIIDGKVYDTETATELANDSYSYPGDFDYWDETLYRTEKGAYFLAGEGGPNTGYRETVSLNCWQGGSEIRPLSKGEALKWAERHASMKLVEQEFADAIIEA